MLGTVTKGLVQGLEDLEIKRRVETIQTSALLRSAIIQGRLKETCCHINSNGKSSTNAGVKNSWEYNNNINNNNNCWVSHTFFHTMN